MAATCTAQITVGSFPGGWGMPNLGIGPSWVMYLVEGSRAAWVLETVVHNTDGWREPTTWVPRRPESILVDGLVMIAVLVDEATEPRELIEERLKQPEAKALLDSDYVDLTEMDEQALEAIETAAATAVRSKLVVAVMDGSSLAGQLGLLERYSMDAEVCTVSWSRHTDDAGEVRSAGALPPEDPGAHRFYELRT